MKKLLKFLLFTVILSAIALLAVNIYVCQSSEEKMYDTVHASYLPTDADCIIVLGAGLKDDGTPNHMLRDRLDLAVELYDAGICKRLLLTGDHGSEEYDEVNAMKDYVLAKGVDSADIYLDHAGFSTYDSMYRAKAVFGVKKAIAVTQKYHLYRSVYIAKKLGIDIYGINSDPYTYVGQASRNVREYLARFKDFFGVMFEVKPKYLGEKIDIKVSASEVTYG